MILQCSQPIQIAKDAMIGKLTVRNLFPGQKAKNIVQELFVSGL